MQQGYYTKRIEKLEKRKEEVTAQLVTSKLTLKGINKEIENCYEYMNSAHYDIDSNQIASKYEDKILSLQNTIKRKDNKLERYKKEVNKQENTISDLNGIIKDYEHELEVLKLRHHNELARLQQDLSDEIIKKHRGHTSNLMQKKDSVIDSLNESINAISQENKTLKKENRKFKRDIEALNERIKMMDSTIQKKNKELKTLHQRLNWIPKDSPDVSMEGK